MSTQSRRVVLGLAAGLAAVTLLAGCAGTSGAAESEPAADGAPETTSISIGILPIPGYAPIQIAQDEGFFEDEGLNVTVETMAPGTAVPSIVGGSLQFAGQNWLAVLQAMGQGVELEPVAELERGTAGYAEFIVPADSPVESLADLDGKTVGVVATPGNCDLIAQAVLSSEGEDATPQYVNIAVPDMPGNLERGGIDAACVPEPLLSSLKASGFRSVFDAFTGDYTDFPVSGIFTSSKFAADNPNTVAAVQRALGRSNELAQSDPDVVRNAVPEYTQVPAEAAAAMTLPTFPVTDFQALTAVADLLEESGLASNLDIRGVTDK